MMGACCSKVLCADSCIEAAQNDGMVIREELEPMMVLKWNDTLKTGVQDLDEQHQSLVEIVNRLNDALATGREDRRKAVGVILSELLDYTITHFRCEEGYMESIGFPQLEDHKRLHVDLVERLQKRVAIYIAGQAMEISLMSFLSDWLVNHILGEDSKYAAFARKREDAGRMSLLN